MSAISIPQIPATPPSPTTELEIRSCTSTRSLSAYEEIIAGMDTQYVSPPPRASCNLTPPPSSQIPQSSTKSSQTHPFVNRECIPASPPPTFKIGSTPYAAGLFGEIPTADSMRELNEEQLRSLVTELFSALGEARMTTAHAKLQHSLLTIESSEMVKRAEVEHEMTRREVQALRDCTQLQRGGQAMSPLAPQSPAQRHLDLALKHCRELKIENALLERKVKRAKKWIIQLDGKNTELMDEVELLRQRIRQNRDHLNAMSTSGAISVHGTPLPDLSSPAQNRTPKVCRTTLRANRHVGNQDPFGALLFAGQVLNGETNSVPSTPSVIRLKKPRSTHMRGAHSLSSLPITPNRSGPITAEGAPSTPVDQLAVEYRANFSAQVTPNDEDRREDRDSTISASDNEERYMDYNVPASEASQRATSILRRTPSKKGDKVTSSVKGRSLRGMKQGILHGHIKKAGIERHEPVHQKRGSDVTTYDESFRTKKRTSLGDGFSKKVGLGIGTWSSPGR